MLKLKNLCLTLPFLAFTLTAQQSIAQSSCTSFLKSAQSKADSLNAQMDVIFDFLGSKNEISIYESHIKEVSRSTWEQGQWQALPTQIHDVNINLIHTNSIRNGEKFFRVSQLTEKDFDIGGEIVSSSLFQAFIHFTTKNNNYAQEGIKDQFQVSQPRPDLLLITDVRQTPVPYSSQMMTEKVVLELEKTKTPGQLIQRVSYEEKIHDNNTNISGTRIEMETVHLRLQTQAAIKDLMDIYFAGEGRDQKLLH